MPREITPYLMFDGDCKAAMTFYQQVLGGKLDVMTYGQADPNAAASDKDKVIHARLESGPTVIMASDSGHGIPVKDGDDVWLSLQCGPASEVDAIYAKGARHRSRRMTHSGARGSACSWTSSACSGC